MNKLEVFEPAMCCPTGVCGVNVDPALVQFNADLQELAKAGVEVVRHSLNHDPAAFAGNAAVVRELEAGMDRLPILAVNGHVVSTGLYPSKAQLMSRLGLAGSDAGEPHMSPGGCGCSSGRCG